MGEIRNAQIILVLTPEGKKLLLRPKCKCKDNIRTDLGEIWWEGVGWMHLAQVRNQWRVLLNTVMNFRVQKRRGI
jgi:hypothetical protein